VLQIRKKEILPDIYTDICQTDAGTIYYWRFNSAPHSLHVKSNGREIYATLPSEQLQSVGAHGNAVHFASEGKIYQAVFSPSNIIDVSYLRDQYEDEEFYHWGLCRQIRDGKKYVYRLFEDPLTNGILINLSDDEENQLSLWGINRLAI
ncbi:hypothetical protein PMAYCL1PPCAC_05630, partial [Pristionchus mayeri]